MIFYMVRRCGLQGITALMVWLVMNSLPLMAEENFYEVYKVPEPPVIDGKLTDAPWLNIPMRTGFTRLHKSDMYMVPRLQTEVRIGYDEKAVYFGIKAREPRLDEHLEKAKKNETGTANWKYQLVEFFLDPLGPEGGRHFQFAVDILGHVAAFKADVGDEQYDWKSTKWEQIPESEWQHAVGIYDDYFVVEAAIPVELLGKVPEPGEAWGGQVGRHGTWSHDGMHWRLCMWSQMFISPSGFWKQVIEHAKFNFMPEVLIPDFQNVGLKSKRMNREYNEWALTLGESFKALADIRKRAEGTQNLVWRELPDNKITFVSKFPGVIAPLNPEKHQRRSIGVMMPFAEHPHSFILKWEKPVTFNSMIVEWKAASAVGTVYSLEIMQDGAWKKACLVNDNKMPVSACEFDPVTTDKARFTVYERNYSGGYFGIQNIALHQLKPSVEKE